MSRPILSVIVVVYNMEREAPRTLYTLSQVYQSGTDKDDYEVMVIDNGSKIPLSEAFVKTFGSNFFLLRFNPNPSPAQAINQAVRIARGHLVMICIDGARLLSPGILNLTIKAHSIYKNALVACPSYHLGPKIQNDSIAEGYKQDVEDLLLESICWRENGYKLFSKSVFATSSRNGWFLPLHESNCLTLSKVAYIKLNGYCEDFLSPGGGFSNLDFYKRACESHKNLVILFGEGTFHQVHGGVATNSTREQNAAAVFHTEYVKIRGEEYVAPQKVPIFFGKILIESIPFLEKSIELFKQQSAI